MKFGTTMKCFLFKILEDISHFCGVTLALLMTCALGYKAIIKSWIPVKTGFLDLSLDTKNSLPSQET